MTRLAAYRSRFSAQHELREKADTDPRRPFDTGCILTLGIGSPRDVEVGPRKAVDKLPQEPAGGDTPRGSPTAVLDVGDVRFHEITIIVPERQRPDPLVGAVT